MNEEFIISARQMRDTADYIDKYNNYPDDLAEFLRHWANTILGED